MADIQLGLHVRPLRTGVIAVSDLLLALLLDPLSPAVLPCLVSVEEDMLSPAVTCCPRARYYPREGDNGGDL